MCQNSVTDPRPQFIAITTSIDTETAPTVRRAGRNGAELNLAGPGQAVAPLTFVGSVKSLRRLLDAWTAQLDQLDPVDLDAEHGVGALA